MRHPVLQEDFAEIAALDLPFSRLKGKTVLVTGASGFLPAYLIESLLYLNETRRLGIKILGLVRNEVKARARFKRYASRRDLHLFESDASKRLRLPDHIDWILHAASQASPVLYGNDPVGTLGPNVFGTRHFLELARTKRAAFLFFSSCEIYGDSADRRTRLKEEDLGLVDPLHPRACYAEGKRMGETLCTAWNRQYGVHTVIIRIFHTYGPGMPLGDGRAFSDFTGDVVAGRNIVVRGDGKAKRTYCYLGDTISGALTVMLKAPSGSVYNLGNDRNEVSVYGLARRLTQLFPEKRLRVERHGWSRGTNYLPSPFKRFCPNVSRLRALGWAPRHDVDSGFRRTVRYYA